MIVFIGNLVRPKNENAATLMEAFSRLPALNVASVNYLVESLRFKMTNNIDAIAPTKVTTNSVA